MSEKYIVSQHFKDNEFGDVALRVQSNANGMRARWQGGMLKIIMPRGVTLNDFIKAFDSMRPQLRQLKPTSFYHNGQVFDFEDFRVTIQKSNMLNSNKISIDATNIDHLKILVGMALDFDRGSVEKMIAKMLLRIAKAKSFSLVTRFHEEVERLGITNYAGFDISHGLQRLGYCTAKKEIYISSAVTFLPPELQRMIICHELAHLREMNHSPRFHAILNEYMNGRAVALEQRLKNFAWPVPR